jgi:hypothetical protein
LPWDQRRRGLWLPKATDDGGGRAGCVWPGMWKDSACVQVVEGVVRICLVVERHTSHSWGRSIRYRTCTACIPKMRGYFAAEEAAGIVAAALVAAPAACVLGEVRGGVVVGQTRTRSTLRWTWDSSTYRRYIPILVVAVTAVVAAAVVGNTAAAVGAVAGLHQEAGSTVVAVAQEFVACCPGSDTLAAAAAASVVAGRRTAAQCLEKQKGVGCR